MASTRIVDLPADTSPATGDFVVTVDISDTTDAADGSSKKVTIANLIAALAAIQATQEAGSSTILFVTPGVQHFHPSAAKCWGEFTANSTTILLSYNITSLADTATGAMTVTIGTDFSSASWACHVTRSEDDMTLVYSATYDAKAAGTVILRSVVEAGSGSDPTAASGNASWSFIGFGDFA